MIFDDQPWPSWWCLFEFGFCSSDSMIVFPGFVYEYTYSKFTVLFLIQAYETASYSYEAIRKRAILLTAFFTFQDLR